MKFSKSISDKGNNKINVNNLPVNSIINSNLNLNFGNFNNKKIVCFAKNSTVSGDEVKNGVDGNFNSNCYVNADNVNKKNVKERRNSIKFFQSSAIKRSQSSAAKNNIGTVNKTAAKKK